MKKIISVIVILSAISIMACNDSKMPKNTEVTGSVYVENTTSEVEVTTTADENIISNSAGIIIRDEEEVTTTRSTEQLSDERRGINSRFGNCYISADGDMERLGVTKKIVFACDSYNTGSDLDPAVISRFNELLVNKYGCDFVLELIGLESMGMKKYGYTYVDIVSDMKSLGQHVDIMMGMVPAYYTKLVEEGYLLDITDYLAEDEEGRKLYDAYPEAIWETVKINGRIYGYAPFSLPAYMYALNCNKEMADRFGIKVEEGFSFYEIGKIFDEADINEDFGEVVPIFLSEGYAYAMLDCIDLGYGLFGRKDADGNWVAFNATQDEGFLKLWKTIREYKEKGWINNNGVDYQAVTEGKFIFSGNIFSSSDMVENTILFRRTVNRTTVHEIIDIIPGDIRYGYYGPRENLVYGVTSWSEYKDEALKLITLMQTEPELCNLLSYGIENVHYVYEDKKVTRLPSSSGWGIKGGSAITFVNPNLIYPTYIEPDNKLKFYKELSINFEKDPRLDCSISVSGYYDLFDNYEEQTKILEQIYEQGYTKLLNGEYEDVEAAAEINRMQMEAGIDEIINMLNERFSRKESAE